MTQDGSSKSPSASGHPLIEAFARGDAGAARDALTPDAVFHGPVADYRGRDQIDPALDALSRVLTVTGTEAVHWDDDETAWFFTAEVAGKNADGVLRVVTGRAGGATAVTLMIRPLNTLLAGVKAIGR
jgi:SnoaL-like domain